jgi:hypothetical protein
MKSLGLSRRALSCAALALLAACGASQPPIGARGEVNANGDSLPYHKTLHYTGKEQSFVVPAGVTSITVVARGAAGAGIGEYGNLSGFGGRVYAVIPVTPLERLHVYVGGAGVNYGPRGYGGFNGGGNSFCCGGLAGGGATDIREGGDKLDNRVLVAGGGGGQGGMERGGAGGDGGGLTGRSGADGTQAGSSDGDGGFGGTQSAGGTGGSGGNGDGSQAKNGKRGRSGHLGRGGNGGSGGAGQSSDQWGGAGGGGGGGYFGGGGGGGGGSGSGAGNGWPGGGGGGGSSYVEPSATRFHTWSGWKNATGDGLVVISWQ